MSEPGSPRSLSLALVAAIVALVTSGPAPALEDREELPELPEPLDLGDDPIFEGSIKFLEVEAGEKYRTGLEALKYRAYDRAYSLFRDGRRRVQEVSETAIFDRLVAEAKAGKDLERIEKSIRSKRSALRALSSIEKALPDLDGLVLKKEYLRLQTRIRDDLYLVIDDFEPAKGEEETGGDGGDDEGATDSDNADDADPDDADPDDGGADDGDGRRGRGRGGLSRFFRSFGLDSGERQSAKPDETKVRQGSYSYRWKVGKDAQAKTYDIDSKTFGDYRYLDLSVRGSSLTAIRLTILLLHEGTNLGRLYFQPRAFRGYEAQLTVQGTRWKDYRLEIGKDLRPNDAPDNTRIAQMILLVRPQGVEDVIYLDEIKLEK